MDFPLLDSVDGILLATYTDSLYEDSDQFELPVEIDSYMLKVGTQLVEGVQHNQFPARRKIMLRSRP